jgi:hypothetical protein
MGPQHIRDGILFVRQQKTSMAKADEVLEIPIHPELARIIAASKGGNLAFLVTGYGCRPSPAPASVIYFANGATKQIFTSARHMVCEKLPAAGSPRPAAPRRKSPRSADTKHSLRFSATSLLPTRRGSLDKLSAR